MDNIEVPQVVNKVTDKIESWIETAIAMLPNFVIAILVVTAFWIIARLVRKGIRKAAAKFSDNQAIIKLVSTIVYVVVIAVGAFTALSVLHLDKAVTSLLAGVGVVGLALGFAFQDIVANFVAGFLIASRKPYQIGDLIESNGFLGHVKDVNLRNTRVRTFDGQDVILPNKEVFGKPLINYSMHPKRRVDIEVGVSYNDDLHQVEKVTKETIKALDCIDKTEDIQFFYTGFGGSSIDISLRFWVNETLQPKYLRARSEAIKMIKDAFDDNGISIPFPIRTLEFDAGTLKQELSDLTNNSNQ